MTCWSRWPWPAIRPIRTASSWWNAPASWSWSKTDDAWTRHCWTSTDLVTAETLEQGLLGIALHPDFEANGRTFLYYTSRDGDMVIAEYRLDPATGSATADEPHNLLSIPDPNPFHNGGQLAFGPDGYLYIGVGDGGLLEGGWRDGRDPASLLGKILRIDVDSQPAVGAAYAIPPDNPYVGVRPMPGPRSGRLACGTRGASRSTSRPQSSGSLTSAS